MWGSSAHCGITSICSHPSRTRWSMPGAMWCGTRPLALEVFPDRLAADHKPGNVQDQAEPDHCQRGEGKGLVAGAVAHHAEVDAEGDQAHGAEDEHLVGG